MSVHHAGALAEATRVRLVARRTIAGAGLLPFGIARRMLIASFEHLLLWQERASQRHHLSMADDQMLKDIGLTRTQVAREIRKPFWRP